VTGDKPTSFAVRVSLGWSEVLQAAQAGCFRHVEDMKKGRKDCYGAPVDGEVAS